MTKKQTCTIKNTDRLVVEKGRPLRRSPKEKKETLMFLTARQWHFFVADKFRKKYFYCYIHYLKSGSTKKEQSHCARHNRNM